MERSIGWERSFEKDVGIAQDIAIGRPRLEALHKFFRTLRPQGFFKKRRRARNIPRDIENSASVDTITTASEHNEPLQDATQHQEPTSRPEAIQTTEIVSLQASQLEVEETQPPNLPQILTPPETLPSENLESPEGSQNHSTSQQTYTLDQSLLNHIPDAVSANIPFDEPPQVLHPSDDGLIIEDHPITTEDGRLQEFHAFEVDMAGEQSRQIADITVATSADEPVFITVENLEEEPASQQVDNATRPTTPACLPTQAESPSSRSAVPPITIERPVEEVDSSPAVTVVQKIVYKKFGTNLYEATRLAPAESYRLPWTNTWKSSLNKKLRQLHLGSHVVTNLKLSMIGPQQEEPFMTPTIVVICTSKKREIENSLREFVSLFVPRVDFRVVERRITLASGACGYPSQPGNMTSTLVRVKIDGELQSIMGCLAYVQTQPKRDVDFQSTFTIGGLLSLGDSLFALTIAHAMFQKEGVQQSCAELAICGTVESYEWSGNIREKPPLVPTTPETAMDWMLVKVTDRFMLPNIFRDPESGATRVVHGYIREKKLTDGRVLVCAGITGTQAGYLISTPSTIMYGNVEYEVLTIDLEAPLASGDSGSWVIRDDQVCGCIFARIEDEGIAYMIPIETILNRLPEVYKKGRRNPTVRIPDASRIQKLASLSISSRTAASEDTKASISTHQQATTGSENNPNQAILMSINQEDLDNSDQNPSVNADQRIPTNTLTINDQQPSVNASQQLSIDTQQPQPQPLSQDFIEPSPTVTLTDNELIHPAPRSPVTFEVANIAVVAKSGTYDAVKSSAFTPHVFKYGNWQFRQDRNTRADTQASNSTTGNLSATASLTTWPRLYSRRPPRLEVVLLKLNYLLRLKKDTMPNLRHMILALLAIILILCALAAFTLALLGFVTVTASVGDRIGIAIGLLAISVAFAALGRLILQRIWPADELVLKISGRGSENDDGIELHTM